MDNRNESWIIGMSHKMGHRTVRREIGHKMVGKDR